MYVVVLAAETDSTGRSIAFLIAVLLGIAAIMTCLTVWYWRFTSPKQVAERMALSIGPTHGFSPPETVLSIEEPEPERASERPGPMVAHPLTDDQSAPQREMIPQASRSDVGDEDAECIEADDELVGADALAYDGPKLAESEQGLTPGYSISDEAWERITQSMLGGFGAEKSET